MSEKKAKKSKKEKKKKKEKKEKQKCEKKKHKKEEKGKKRKRPPDVPYEEESLRSSKHVKAAMMEEPPASSSSVLSSLHIGQAARCGKRPSMEDRHWVDSFGGPHGQYIGVFDGHGGTSPTLLTLTLELITLTLSNRRRSGDICQATDASNSHEGAQTAEQGLVLPTP